ncbi:MULTISPECIES: adenylate/guanylate cyclase domain-containing protein [Nocardiopsis]|nr:MULTISPECIES: adenylate/guanylate cyclase domain-containing protein [Nocardiopsis]APC37355.1 adenylate/guanylate cyclase domain-containing protein [Nocardiopsis dassonvillei]NKY81082.1 adenylate/guanylate cyclase domain-containing protein [Nocardiopsis dassonvillei]VEI89844.1 pH-sensitive adenylate cyclase Rv1264 [Nocardiopsis dassonvillei]
MPSRPDPKAIESALLGGEAVYTREQAIELAGADNELAGRIWRALGFPNQGDDTVTFAESDVESLRIANSLVQEGVLDEEGVVRFARAMGQTMARLADWQTSILSTLIYQEGEDSVSPLMNRVKELLPDVERLLLHIWRRQLAASSARTLAVMSDNDAVPNYYPLVVGFADLVSFTTLSRELDEVELAGVVEGFEATAADIVASGGGRVVKTLGDEILYVADSPAEAADIALRLASGVKTHVEVPDVRVGLAAGPVLTLHGDVFGTTVNRSSRLTSFARPGTVLIDESLAESLAEEEGLQVVQVRARHAHGLGLIQPYALRRNFEPAG